MGGSSAAAVGDVILFQWSSAERVRPRAPDPAVSLVVCSNFAPSRLPIVKRWHILVTSAECDFWMRLNQIALSRFPFGETTVNTVVSPEGHVAKPVGGLARAVSQQGIWVNRPQRSMHCDLHRVDSNRMQYYR